MRSGGSIEIGQTFDEGKIKSTRNTQQFLKAMSQLRNTSVPDCGVFPAEIVFGTPLDRKMVGKRRGIEGSLYTIK